MNIALVADKNTVTCFKLGGLKDVYQVKNAEEAGKRVRELSEKPEVAIILVAESYVDQISHLVEEIIERKYPLIIPIPTLAKPTPVKTDFIVELIRRKAGIEVKL